MPLPHHPTIESTRSHIAICGWLFATLCGCSSPAAVNEPTPSTEDIGDATLDVGAPQDGSDSVEHHDVEALDALAGPNPPACALYGVPTATAIIDDPLVAEISGLAADVKAMLDDCSEGPPGADVAGVESHRAEPPESKGFRVLPTV